MLRLWWSAADAHAHTSSFASDDASVVAAGDAAGASVDAAK